MVRSSQLLEVCIVVTCLCVCVIVQVDGRHIARPGLPDSLAPGQSRQGDHSEQVQPGQSRPGDHSEQLLPGQSRQGDHSEQVQPGQSGQGDQSDQLLPGQSRPGLHSEQVQSKIGNHDHGVVKVKVRRQAVINRHNLWPGGIVPYILDQAYTQETRDIIELAMREIEQDVGSKTQPCVQFVPRSTEVNYLDVRLGAGCNSVIGLDYTGPQVSTYSLECAVKGSVLHELLHTLGLYHEMDRYDRDAFLDINATNLREDSVQNFVLKNESEIDTLGTPYDYTSIMQYGPYSFAKDLRLPVMTPKSQFANGTWMGQRIALSRLDVLRVQRLYRCEENTSHISSDISEDNRLAWCDFSYGVCNFSITVSSPKEGSGADMVQDDSTGADKSLWTVTASKTPDGPVAGFTNGLDPFFYASKEFAEQVSKCVSDHATLTHSSRARSLETNADSAKPVDTDKGSSQFIEAAPVSISLTESASKAGRSPGVAQQTSNVTETSVSLITPMITSNSNACCIDYHIFQSGPSSFMAMYVSGPLIPRIQLFSLRGIVRDHWATIRQSLQVPPGIQFQLELAVVLDQGSVAIDNLHVYKGLCL